MLDGVVRAVVARQQAIAKRQEQLGLGLETDVVHGLGHMQYLLRPGAAFAQVAAVRCRTGGAQKASQMLAVVAVYFQIRGRRL